MSDAPGDRTSARSGTPTDALPADSLLPDSVVLEAIEQITDSALAYLSLEEMLGELLERIRHLIGADTAAILMLDADRGVMLARAARGIEEEVRQGVQIPVGRGFAGRIAAERRPIIIDDVDHADILNPLLRLRGIRSLLGVPLLIEGRVIGVMHVGTVRPRLFGPSDVQMMQMAGDRAALAIDNAQLTEQRALTAVLQRTLLPPAPPEIPGLRISALYLPAGAGIKIGGDWYDVFTMPDGRVAFVIGDVVGRGVVAASVMAEIRAALRAYALEGHEPTMVMTRLNDLLLTLGSNRSATVAMLAFDLETEELAAVSAGHVPVMRRDAAGAIEMLAHASGPPLGAYRRAHYTEERHTLPAGSALLLYTDGLIERRGESIDDGIDELTSAFAAASHPLAQEVFRTLGRDPEDDDVALLAAEVLPLEPRLAITLDTRPVLLSGLRRAVARWLMGHGVAAEERFAITLACSEASANAVEHAYGPRQSTFTVRCSLAEDEVTVTVRDDGSWRSLEGRKPGRGLMLMRELMDHVDVDRQPTGTTVTMTKRLGPQA